VKEAEWLAKVRATQASYISRQTHYSPDTDAANAGNIFH
jgi:hypothetical protein